MPNKIKFSPTGSEADSIFAGNTAINVSQPNTGGGPSSVTGLYNAPATPTDGYAVYNNEVVFVANNDTDLINHLNNLGAGATTIEQALSWAVANSIAVVNRDYDSVTTDGLIMCLDPEFTPSYPLSGNTIYDLSGSANNGILQNGVYYTSGYLVFDGANDKVTIPSLASNEFTYSLWVNKTSTVVDATSIISNEGTLLRVNTSQISWWSNVNAGPSTYNFTPTLNRWYNIVVAQNASAYKFYIDGALVRQGTMSLPNLTYGRNTLGSWGGGNTWLGKISTTLIYNRELDPTEVYQNFEAQKERFGFTEMVTDGLVLNLDANNPYSYVDGSSGTTWSDTSGQGNDGTLTNGPTFNSTNGINSMVFDGSNDYVINSNFTITPTNNELSISLWYKTSNNATEKMLIDLCGITNNSSNRDFFSIRQNWQSNNKISCYFNSTAGFQYVAFPNQVETNTWNNIVYSKVGNTLNAYLNGAIVATSNVTGNIRTIQRYIIANDNLFGSNLFAGNMANVLIYNRGISADEVLQNFNAQKSRFGL